MLSNTEILWFLQQIHERLKGVELYSNQYQFNHRLNDCEVFLRDKWKEAEKDQNDELNMDTFIDNMLNSK